MTQKITPTLMYVGEQCGKAEEAIKLYTSVFRNSEIGDIIATARSGTRQRRNHSACRVHA